jgi:hypothetical protein
MEDSSFRSKVFPKVRPTFTDHSLCYAPKSGFIFEQMRTLLRTPTNSPTLRLFETP